LANQATFIYCDVPDLTNNHELKKRRTGGAKEVLSSKRGPVFVAWAKALACESDAETQIRMIFLIITVDGYYKK
jgi:hypothetical protein